MYGYKRYLLAVALFVLVAFCGYFYVAFKHVNHLLLQEKIIDRRFDIDIICDEIDRIIIQNNDWDTYNYKSILASLSSKIDATIGTYSELFDDQMNSLSIRKPLFGMAPFVPHNYPALMDAINNHEHGDIEIMFNETTAAAIPHKIYIYFRWTPTDKNLKNRMLVIVGVSRFSLNSNIGNDIVYGAVALIIVTAVFILVTVILLCQLGFIYKSRKGEDKWRQKISSSL